jgi:anaerobic selenocysteine-containing dehydrogenase
MLHLDYNWDLNPDGIIFDEELNIDRLGWKHGDMFKITNRNGRAMLVKVEPIEAFFKGYKVNCDE